MDISNGKLKLFVSAIPNSNTTRIRSIDEVEIKIEIDEPPENNKANNKLVKFLSKMFKIEKQKIQIIGGATSKHKIVIINQDLSKEDALKIMQGG
ncbi:UPF0235 protein [Nosema bombycis CQ1]|uniref:UPF0235 protein n=1 Tax=Nosema bombycis (strain CQ1 / CVCC 102059) TaxID=578461 RepID=R0KUG6_NOSB1|nr:UPF0235 protein [Nosema bombycis CQ1]|eukprot:EOB14481.1 UPF0235 protein [Nosema bombycis CQ1]